MDDPFPTFGRVWRWADTFRRSDKNIGGPWYQIATSLHILCEDAKIWIEKRKQGDGISLKCC
jgi:fido (protein-threonine AMPylation protein)